tara:strand:- start:1764 stop:2675 length:912 start_codon:yes stop_codon:yes gene_type:complete
MANQNYVVKTNGIGADPSASYSPVSGGWEKSIASGVVTWLPTGPTNGMGKVTDFVGPTVVTNKGLVANTMDWDDDITGDGTGAGSNDTVQLTLSSGATCTTSTADITINVTSSTGGGNGGGTQKISGSDIISVSSGGLITVTAGLLGSAFVGDIAFKEDSDEPAETFSSAPIPVDGVEVINLYAPASGDGEIGVKWEWSADDVAGGTDSTATWTQFAAYATNSAITAADHTLNDKAKYVRLSVLCTDADIDGVAEVNTVLGHESTGAKATWAVPNDASNNKPIRALGSESTSGSIGGIGEDPS